MSAPARRRAVGAVRYQAIWSIAVLQSRISVVRIFGRLQIGIFLNLALGYETQAILGNLSLNGASIKPQNRRGALFLSLVLIQNQLQISPLEFIDGGAVSDDRSLVRRMAGNIAKHWGSNHFRGAEVLR